MSYTHPGDHEEPFPEDFRRDVVKYADPAMFTAVPLPLDSRGAVIPRVTLVEMTGHPVRVMAAVHQMYSGKPVGNPMALTREECEEAWIDSTQTILKAPLEFIQLHFLIEGVSRPWANQLERQRTATYAQESLRFAVKEEAANEVILPPHLWGRKDDDPLVVIWHDLVARIGWGYNALVAGGMPAEDARGILPLNIGTRVHYRTDLRNLAQHAGMRLCTQAQFEWRQVWSGFISALRDEPFNQPGNGYLDEWEYNLIADMFKPICYQTGKCEFMASTDRFCTIRDRVQSHARAAQPSTTWLDIHPAEWMFNPNAARGEK